MLIGHASLLQTDNLGQAGDAHGEREVLPCTGLIPQGGQAVLACKSSLGLPCDGAWDEVWEETSLGLIVVSHPVLTLVVRHVEGLGLLAWC